MNNHYVVRYDGEEVTIYISTRKGPELALIDAEDFPKLDDFCTFGLTDGKARSGKKSGQQYLHRIIAGEIPKGSCLEWINGNMLDCRKENLQL